VGVWASEGSGRGRPSIRNHSGDRVLARSNRRGIGPLVSQRVLLAVPEFYASQKLEPAGGRPTAEQPADHQPEMSCSLNPSNQAVS